MQGACWEIPGRGPGVAETSDHDAGVTAARTWCSRRFPPSAERGVLCARILFINLESILTHEMVAGFYILSSLGSHYHLVFIEMKRTFLLSLESVPARDRKEPIYEGDPWHLQDGPLQALFSVGFCWF